MLTAQHEKYNSLFGELQVWRDKTYDVTLTGQKGILPFVSGLRFSANVLYIANAIFEGSKLKAAWGHVINENDQYNIYSRESDIIIYKKIPGWKRAHWNGDKINKIMDFYFIDKTAVIGVISCKATVATSVDKKYPKQMEGYTDTIWLFAECCGHNKEKAIKQLALDNGYKDFWTLYSWDEKKSKPNLKSWKRFEDAMLALAKKNP